ncbi:MAG: MtrB/PioB family outer membrane beta-barrel protein [Candidatus Solibacter usitatus]|nr:MtrB/PioB family outer membrane beta-barrel protein [Candidatus Solibacter usitatus]
MTKQSLVAALLPLLLFPTLALCQDEREREKSIIELGVRGITGTVDDRSGLGGVPFSFGFRPDLLSSGINTYRDFRNGIYIPRSSILVERILDTNSYFRLQTASNGIAFQGSTLSRDQSLLATVGQYGLYKLQFVWDQTPHIFSGTTRSLYNQTSPGVWRFTGNRATLDAARLANTGAALLNALNSQVANAFPDVQKTLRKTGSGLASWNINPDWNIAVFFSRQNQLGTRPHGMCFGNSPGCFWSEVPENLNYFTDTVKVSTGIGRKSWEVQLGLRRQSFENQVPNMLVENPFSNGVNSTTVSSNGNMSLYPNNHALNMLFGGALNSGRFHFMSSVSPGRNSQNDPFVAYTTNPFLLAQAGAAAPLPLPARSLNGAFTRRMPNSAARGFSAGRIP